MSLVMAVVSPQAAYMLSDGFALRNGSVISREFRKIFTLPSGDKLIATGSTYVLRLIEELRAAEPMQGQQTIDRIKQWMAKDCDPVGYHIGLIGRHEGLLRAWRGASFVAHCHIPMDCSKLCVLCDGCFDPYNTDLENPEYRLEVRRSLLQIADEKSFHIATQKLRQLFDKIYGDWPQYIGGKVFEDYMFA
jgi:hypothetical protein